MATKKKKIVLEPGAYSEDVKAMTKVLQRYFDSGEIKHFPGAESYYVAYGELYAQTKESIRQNLGYAAQWHDHEIEDDVGTARRNGSHRGWTLIKDVTTLKGKVTTTPNADIAREYEKNINSSKTSKNEHKANKLAMLKQRLTETQVQLKKLNSNLEEIMQEMQECQ